MKKSEPITILMADDDPDDRLMTEEACKEGGMIDTLRFVEDGEELLEYLERRGKYSDPTSAPRPDVILLDLNMPRKDGRTALAEIKANPELRGIPVLILTSSGDQDDVFRCYDLGAASYIVKPVTFDRVVEVMKALQKYWTQISSLQDQSGC